ncbi:MAG: carbohydrate ABC transporter permease [Anaerolineae bacterium]|nr:carbohydrate ABC transporter permease [Anaerolineae bacterium]
MFSRRPGLSRKWNKPIIHAALILITLFEMLPIFTTVLISFKSQQDITRKPPVLLPCDTSEKLIDLSACRWSVEGYKRVLAPKIKPDSLLGFELSGNMVRIYLVNNFIYAAAASFLVMILAGASGYAFSRFKFRGHKVLLTGIIAITSVPLLTNLLALYQMVISFRKSGLPFDDRVFIVVVYIGFYLPLSIWIAKGFFDAIPKDMEEAALIDGCSPMAALYYITMPLAMPGLLAVALLAFVGVWNDFMAGYLLIAKNEYKPAMFGLYEFLGQNILNLQVLAAACIIIALPVIILFLFTRKSFFKAMVEGGVKG